MATKTKTSSAKKAKPQLLLDGPLKAPVLAPDPLPDDVETVCGNCGWDEFIDVLIHQGRSLRRDCRNCGRTLGFPVWYPEASR